MSPECVAFLLRYCRACGLLCVGKWPLYLLWANADTVKRSGFSSKECARATIIFEPDAWLGLVPLHPIRATERRPSGGVLFCSDFLVALPLSFSVVVRPSSLPDAKHA